MAPATSLASASTSQNLIVAVTNRSLIKASNHSVQPYVDPVSNFDLVPGRFLASVLYLYTKPPNSSSKVAASTIKSTLPGFLDHFFPFAGRITTNSVTDLPQVLCNNEGAEFVEAQANIPLSCLDFYKVRESIDVIIVPYPKEYPLSVQLVEFACGSFSITWSSNHFLVDATSLNMVAISWTEFVRTKKISRIPHHDRSIFPPRSPPTFSSIIGRNYTTCTSNDMINVLASDILLKRLYYVTLHDIENLRTLACQDGHRSTRVEAFSAHVWKVLARVVGEFEEDQCGLGWLVDGRRRLGPRYAPFMQSYMGQALSYASKGASIQKLQQESLTNVAKMVADAIGEVKSEEHFLDLVDWIECHKNEAMFHKSQTGLGFPTIVVSSCHHLPVDLDFGFGQAVLTAFQTGSGRLGSGFMQLAPSPRGDGSWIVNASLWQKVAAALEADPICRFRPVTPISLGLVGHPTDPKRVSRL